MGGITVKHFSQNHLLRTPNFSFVSSTYHFEVKKEDSEIETF